VEGAGVLGRGNGQETLHRQAWNIAGLKDDDPWKELLNIADPLDRVIVASKADFPLSEADLSSLVMEAVASQPNGELRAALALVLYLKLRSSKKIAATAAETLASQLTRVLQPSLTTHEVYGRQLTQCREVANLCSTLTDTPCDRYTRNLLHAFLPDGFSDIEDVLPFEQRKAIVRGYAGAAGFAQAQVNRPGKAA